MDHMVLDSVVPLGLQLMERRCIQKFFIQIHTRCGKVDVLTGGCQMLSHGIGETLPLQLSVTNIAMKQMVALPSLSTIIQLGDGAS